MDSIVLVTGRLDHKERGQTKLIAQEVQAFQPSEDEVARARAARSTGPIVRRIDASAFGAGLVDELKAVFENFPGETEVILEMRTREGLRCLRFGSGYRVRPSAALHAELDALLGSSAQAA
jgi:DNA polymerase-3 subunit alpha